MTRRRNLVARRIDATTRRAVTHTGPITCPDCGPGRRGDGVRHAAGWTGCKARRSW